MKLRFRTVTCLIALLGAVLTPWSHAHDTGQSYIFLNIQGTSIAARVEIGVAELNEVLGLTLSEDLDVSLADIKPHREAVAQYALAHLSLAPDGKPAPLSAGDISLRDTSFTQFVLIDLTLPELQEPAQFIDVEYSGVFDTKADHVALLVIENNWASSTFNNEAGVSLAFDDATRAARLDLSSATTWNGFVGMFDLGMHHIWGGLDHILFLLALLLPSVMQRRDGHWQPLPDLGSALLNVVKVVTVFTVAHTITLAFATLDIVSMPSRLVESIIAASIAVVALDILVPMFRNWTYSVVLGFGLFHGFGFAGVLMEMTIPPTYMTLTLLGFNLGVEAGQLVIVCAIVPILYLMRNIGLYRKVALPAGACALIAISSYWFIERAFDVDLPAGAIVNELLAREA